MKKIILLTVAFLSISILLNAQSINAPMNPLNPNEFGEAKKIEMLTKEMKDKGIQAIKIKVQVKLVKPIVMGCQYILE